MDEKEEPVVEDEGEDRGERRQEREKKGGERERRLRR